MKEALTVRRTEGAVETFYHLRRRGMSGTAARDYVRKVSGEKLGLYAPDPLCLRTRLAMEAHYDRPGAYTGD